MSDEILDPYIGPDDERYFCLGCGRFVHLNGATQCPVCGTPIPASSVSEPLAEKISE